MNGNMIWYTLIEFIYIFFELFGLYSKFTLIYVESSNCEKEIYEELIYYYGTGIRLKEKL